MRRRASALFLANFSIEICSAKADMCAKQAIKLRGKIEKSLPQIIVMVNDYDYGSDYDFKSREKDLRSPELNIFKILQTLFTVLPSWTIFSANLIRAKNVGGFVS